MTRLYCPGICPGPAINSTFVGEVKKGYVNDLGRRCTCCRRSRRRTTSELAEIVINSTNYELAYSKSDFAFL